jgi:nucleotide-binding universal stress UspA family protein
MATTLAFVDFSNETSAVVQTARSAARAFGMKLILMHISTPDAETEGRQPRTNVSRHGVAAEMHGYHRELEILAKGCTKMGVETTALLVRGRSSRGNPIPKMVKELERVNPDLIVMGTHQHGRLYNAFFGSTSSKLLRKTDCPILLIPSRKSSLKWPTNA